MEILHLPYKGCHEVKPNTHNTAQLDRGMVPLHVRASPLSHSAAAGAASSHGRERAFPKAPAPDRPAKGRLERISRCLFLLHRQAQPARSSSSRQEGRNTAHPRRPQRACGPWLPARLQCPPPLRVPSPAAPPALERSLPASASRSRLCPDRLPLLPLRREACRAASAPRLRRRYGAAARRAGRLPLFPSEKGERRC